MATAAAWVGRAARRAAPAVVTGVPRFAPAHDETLYCAVRALLAHGGQEVDVDWLVGLSGAAFRLAWRQDLLLCPSALQVYDQDPLETLGQALGVVWRRPDTRSFGGLMRTLRVQTTAGCPVLTCGLLGQAEWSVLVGVGPVEQRPGRWPSDPPVPLVHVTARTPTDSDDTYRSLWVRPWSGYAPGPPHRALWRPTPVAWIESRHDPVPSAAQLRPALARAVRAGAAGQQGAYLRGRDAWQAWLDLFHGTDDAAELTSLELARRAWGHSCLTHRLAAARRSAAVFLEQVAELLPHRGPRRLVALAAREYRAVAHQLEHAAALFGPQDAARAAAYADPEVRASTGLHLTQAGRREQTALSYLRGALGRLD